MAQRAPESRTHPRIPALDGVRGLAILMVFLHHALELRLLWMGVDLFFVLSGFLITGVLLDHRGERPGRFFGLFYLRRLQRIWPPYLLFLLLMTFLIGPAWLHRAQYYFFAMNLMEARAVHHPAMTDSLWSLAVEEQFYLVWPFVVFFLRGRWLAWTAAALVVLAPLLRGLYTPYAPTQFYLYYLTPFRMDLLAAGALLAVAWRTRRDAVLRASRFGLPLIALALTLLLVMALRHLSTDTNTPFTNVCIYELTLVISVGVMLFALGGRGVAPLTWRPLRYLGTISYSMYLVHLLGIEIPKHLVANRTLQVAMSAAMILLYGAMSWRFVEKPILAVGRTRGH